MDQIPWVILLYSLPTHRNSERVAVWRRFKKIGALQITTSTYLLPDRPAHYEHFLWLAQQIRDAGGEATMIRAREIEGLPAAKLIESFNKAREKEYALLSKTLRRLMGKNNKATTQRLADEVDRIKRHFRQVREIDFFNSPLAQEVEMLLRKIEKGRGAKDTLPKIHAKNYLGKTWVTRPRPEIDRVGSAWLIRKFIDPEAKFVFANTALAKSNAISFDMLDAEFSHHDEDCTFETLLKRFRIADKALRKIGEMVHDADLEDEKFHRVECVGIDRALKGWAKTGMTDDEILTNGFAFFDGLYAALQRL